MYQALFYVPYMFINSFDPHKNLRRLMLLFLHFTNMEAEAHRSQVIYLKSHSHHEEELDRMSRSSSRAILSALYFICIHA